MLLATLIPGLFLYRHRRQGLGLLCLLLQLTLVGWPLASFLAIRRLYQIQSRQHSRSLRHWLAATQMQ